MHSKKVQRTFRENFETIIEWTIPQHAPRNCEQTRDTCSAGIGYLHQINVIDPYDIISYARFILQLDVYGAAESWQRFRESQLLIPHWRALSFLHWCLILKFNVDDANRLKIYGYSSCSFGFRNINKHRI